MSDARFEDADEAPLRLLAIAPADLPVLAALVQDAVFPAGEMTYAAKRRRFAIFLNRFRWEDAEPAQRAKRPFERVQALLVVENVTHVRSQGIDRGQKESVHSLLDITYNGPEAGPGHVTLTLAGNATIELAVEAPEITLRDATRPYRAVSGKAPDHAI